MVSVRVEREWELFRGGGPLPSGPPSAPLCDVWERTFDDLEERELSLLIAEGQPILVRPDGSLDGDVVSYLHSYSFRNLAAQTQLAYAIDMRIYFSFLFRFGIDWREASESTLEGYALWRLQDLENEKPVTGTRFAREVAAIQRFYRWQVGRGVLDVSPVALRTSRFPDGTIATTARIRPAAVRSSRVKWRTPNAYLKWRRVGLEGHGGREPRLKARNVAFAETLWWSGLRLREASTLLNQEVPAAPPGEQWANGWIAPAVAKGPGRLYLIFDRALRAIRKYRDTNRADSVRRAQASGRYDDLPGILMASSATADHLLVLTDRQGGKRRVSIDALGSEMRRRIFVEGDRGIEPAMLWLQQSGMPMPYTTWAKVFRQANVLCARQGVAITFSPHMMRHSFALKMLLFFLDKSEDTLAPFVKVQGLLGHSNVETTKRIYLEPAVNLSSKGHLESAARAMKADVDEVVSEYFWRKVKETGLVLDVPK